MNFRKSAKGGGGAIFNPKIYIAHFGNFEQGLLSMNLKQKSNASVQTKQSKNKNKQIPTIKLSAVTENNPNKYKTQTNSDGNTKCNDKFQQ